MPDDTMEVVVERLPIRYIRVADACQVTPHLARITFAGDDLADLTCAGPDQQVKLYFPRPGQSVPRLPEPGPDGDFARWYAAFAAIPEAQRPWMRGYTIRAHHPRGMLIDIDFVLHDAAGPATRWAMAARPGDTLGMFGPSPMFARRVPLDASIAAADWVLLAGDETALPGIGTIVEALPEGVRAVVYVEVRDAAEEQRLESRGDLTVHWLHRGAVPPGPGGPLLDAVRAAEFPPGAVFAWLAGEASVVRALRRHLAGERGVDRRSIDFSGYWRHRLTQDDAPTPEDLADAQEFLSTLP